MMISMQTKLECNLVDICAFLQWFSAPLLDGGQLPFFTAFSWKS